MKSFILFLLVLLGFCNVLRICGESSTSSPITSTLISSSDANDRDKRDNQVAENEEQSEDDEEETTEDDNSREKRKKKGPKVWDRWSKWSECSVSCGIGKQTRWRHCVAGDCAPGEKEAQIKTCVMPPC